jgi:hypothetical protein
VVGRKESRDVGMGFSWSLDLISISPTRVPDGGNAGEDSETAAI